MTVPSCLVCPAWAYAERLSPLTVVLLDNSLTSFGAIERERIVCAGVRGQLSRPVSLLLWSQWLNWCPQAHKAKLVTAEQEFKS